MNFEVYNEHEDGIFEPGECAVIHNVRVKNTCTSPDFRPASSSPVLQTD